MIKPLRSFALAALALLSCALHAQSDVVWSDGFDDYVKFQAAETGARNTHPAAVNEQQVKTFLRALKLRDDEDDLVPLFTKDELGFLPEVFAKGLARAKPDQDMVFLITARRGTFILGPKSAITGRVFVADGRIHLIVGEAHKGFAAHLRNTGKMPDFSFGHRGRASKVALVGDGIVYPDGNRQDWVAWDLSRTETAPAKPEKRESGDTPAPATTPAPAAAPPAETRDDVEQRLQRLQRLHKQGLITDKDYEEKRKEILRDL